MTLNECIGRTCAYYKQDIKSIQAIEFARWVDDNIVNFDDFYKQITRGFEPTATVPFPTLAHIEKIYVRPQPVYKSDVKQLTDIEVEGVKDFTTGGVKIDFSEIIKDFNHHIVFNKEHSKFLNKYKFKASAEFFRILRKWFTENNFQDYNHMTGKLMYPFGGFTFEMLEKYKNEFNKKIGG